MKVLAILSAGLALLVSTAWSSAATTRQTSPQGAHLHLSGFHPLLPMRLSGVSATSRGPHLLQAGPTATPTATTPPTVQPTVTSTPNNWPDPTTLVQRMLTVYGAVRSLHFAQVTIEEQQPHIEKVTITATGDATCKNQAVKAHLVGTDKLEGTSQVKKLNAYYVQIGKKAWELSPQETHKVWKQVKLSKMSNLSLTIDNFLACASSSSSSSGSGGSSLKDLTNLGPDTFQGIAVWHVRGTLVISDGSGNTSDAQVDFLIGRDHYLPYVYQVSATDTQNNITLNEKQTLTKFGEKLNITAPKVGTAKP